MSNREDSYIVDNLHPINIVESLAANKDWTFDRVAEDQIAMAVEGVWRTYSLTLAWSEADETLKMVCSFDLKLQEGRAVEFHDALNRVNDRCWIGTFTLWTEQGLIVYRYGLVLKGGLVASTEQIEFLLNSAVVCCDKFYPSFQAVNLGGKSAGESMKLAIDDALGHA